MKFHKFLDFNIAESGEDPYFLNIRQTDFLDSESLFNSIVMDVANENVSEIVFFSKKSGSVYAPYDGGADIFILNDKKRSEVKQIFSSWISERSDGL
jgi:hypothetical protein